MLVLSGRSVARVLGDLVVADLGLVCRHLAHLLLHHVTQLPLLLLTLVLLLFLLLLVSISCFITLNIVRLVIPKKLVIVSIRLVLIAGIAISFLSIEMHAQTIS